MEGLIILNIILTIVNLAAIIISSGTIIDNQKYWGEKNGLKRLKDRFNKNK